MKHLIIFAFWVFLFLNASIVAFACFCPREKPCAYMAGADAVFIGTATKTQMVVSENILAPSSAVSTSVISNETQQTRFNVEKSFIGVTEQEIEVSGGGTTCDFDFTEGGRYLVFAERSSDGRTLFTSFCMGTTSEKEAQNEGTISFLEKNISKPSGGVFEGIVGIWNGKPLSKVKIGIKSETNKLQTFTRKNGSFTLKGIPQGKYTLNIYSPLEIEVVTLYEMKKLKKNEWKIEIKNSACYRAKFGHFRNTK